MELCRISHGFLLTTSVEMMKRWDDLLQPRAFRHVIAHLHGKLFNSSGIAWGVCGAVRGCQAQRAAMQPCPEPAIVADQLKVRLRDKPNLPQVANMAHLGAAIRAGIHTNFRMTPQEHMIRMRVISPGSSAVTLARPPASIGWNGVRQSRSRRWAEGENFLDRLTHRRIPTQARREITSRRTDVR